MVPTERPSRFLSFLLRHRPQDYPLSFDERGFVPLAQLLEVVQGRFPDAQVTDLLNVVEDVDKMRVELLDGLVRAAYGHSFHVNLEHKRIPPPLCLYHGTTRDLPEYLLETGLKPQESHFVHLSDSA
jgi:putative RNA 2'-phosphotransferase